MKQLVPLFSLFLLSSCSLFQSKESVLIDARKVCSEDPRLVEKIMSFREKDFDIQVEKNARLGNWQNWELNSGIAKRYDLQWLRLKFDNGKLQTIWIGPRRELAQDLKVIGMIPYDLLSAKGKRLEEYNLGKYLSHDFNGRKIWIEYDPPHSEGYTIRCF